MKEPAGDSEGEGSSDAARRKERGGRFRPVFGVHGSGRPGYLHEKTNPKCQRPLGPCLARLGKEIRHI